MKILYVDAHAIAIYPTATLSPALASRTGSRTIFYGPGFSSAADLDMGLAKFAEREGPFDVAIIGPGLPIVDPSPKAVDGAADYLTRFSAFTAGRAAITRGFRDILDAIESVPARIKAALLLNFDCYGTRAEQIERIDRLGLVVIAPHDQFVTALDDLPAYARDERHYVRKAKILSDAWLDWTRAHPERIIPLLHFVSDAEACFRSLSERRYEVSIPGIQYVLRDRAVQSLRGSSLKSAPKHVFTAVRLADKLGLKPFSRFMGLRIYNGAFQEGLFDTRFVFTARGGFGIPIRKFFEIPAAGALMVCTPPNGFEALGFEPGRTHIECAPEDVLDAILDLQKRPDDAQRIATAGRELVLSTHSLVARSEQLRASLSAMLAGTYRGVRWERGVFQMSTAG